MWFCLVLGAVQIILGVRHGDAEIVYDKDRDIDIGVQSILIGKQLF